MINNISKFIEDCNEQGILFIVENDELTIKTKRPTLPEEMLVEIKRNKQQIISFFNKKYRVLSFAQERLWFIDQYDHNASYNMPKAVKLIGKLDTKVLEKTFSEIIRRHEVLRTNIITINNVAAQFIHKEPKFELKTVDQSYLSEEETNQQIQKLIEIESQKPFDLANDSLIRLVLYKINNEDHTLFLNKHHIVSDGWSFSVFFKEISILYKAFSENKSSPLPELEIQYADYAIWQREHIEGEVLTKQSEYWKNKLSDTAILELPTGKTRPGEQTFNGTGLPFSLDKDILEKLNTFSKENHVTLFMTLLSAFKVLLNKYTGQDDICVGSPIANRTRSEIEPLIGFFVNTLALRSNLSEDIRFVDLLKQVKQTTLDAYDNQDMPFEKVVDIVQPGRNLSYSPLFQVMMVLQNNPASELSFGELSLKPVEFESTISKFDLTLNFTETTEGLVGGIEYNTDLFDKARIERMTEHFNVLVESIISNPTVNISELEILTSAEKYKLLTEWNNTEADYPKDKCIHQLFEEQVKKTPANIAVVFENKQLSYQELNDKSNQLAHYLQSKGVKPESLVGICVDRSIAMIVGLLGILKAGGAYVPIDPTYPEGRISYMLEDVDCEIVLSQKHLELPKNNSEIIYLDTDWDKIENKPTENVKSEVKSDNLAYVIYTSGSTGKPKGVCIEQKNITNLINFTYNKTNIELSSVLQFISISFDVSAQEIFGTILCGGKLCLVDDEIRINTNKLFKLISNNNIKTVFWPVSFIKMLFNNDNYGLIPQCIRHIITAGEQLVISNTFSKYLKENDVFLHNHYGPSESHVVTALTLNPGEEHPNLPPIGIPIDNTQLYIIDKNLDLVPIGVPGELCISGEQLGRGYFKRPELTAEKFIQNPFSNDPNSRLYKTGDLVKYLPDGNIEFIGRIDSQVKIRGFRIELGEVENVLQTHESISEGVVLAREENGDKYLCAYIVTNQGINQEKLRAFLSTRLPDYMIPSYFVELDKMPLTANGKINRKALPSPEVKAGDDYVAPSNEIEEKLVVIWSEVLNIPKQEISIRANFFAIGGHSLKASNCVNKLINTFHLNIPLIEIFKNPTIVQLANFISADKLNTAVYDDNLALLKKGDVNGTNIFLIHDGSGEINGYIEFCKQADNGINYWGIRAGNMKKHEPVNFTIEQLAKKYLKCVRKIQDHGEYNIAGWSLGGTIAFEMIRQLEQENENVRFLGIMDSMPPNISKNANAVEFTVESELSWIRNYIDNDEVIAGFNAKSDLKDFWYDIIDYLKNIDEIVKDVIIKNIGFEIKESKKSSVEELIKHMNFVRSLSRACNYYKPENAIVSQINYFSASDSKNAFINGWRENSSKDLIVREIEGTHFSIFTLPSVIGLHKAFEACFNNTVDNVFSVNIN